MLTINNKSGLHYYHRKLYAEETPEKVFLKVKEEDYSILLESSSGYIDKTSEFSIIPVIPDCYLTLKNNILQIKRYAPNEQNKHIYIKNLNSLYNILSEVLNDNDEIEVPDDINHLPFICGFTGYFSYDFVRYIENIPDKNEPIDFPDLQFMFTRNAITIDHKNSTLWIVAENKVILNYLINKVNSCKPLKDVDHKTRTVSPKTVSFSEEEFINEVEKTKEYIAQGEIYQANISLQFSQLLKIDPYSFYCKLFNSNPSPFSAYLNFEDIYIICNSPERLIKSTSDGTIETRPIAGTRGRKKEPEEDLKLEQELIECAKERSEHIMLVDLERNDLGKVAEYSSVIVDELFTVEKYSHVMHLVSNVSAKLSKDRDVFDIISALFPGGTITGVPKVRCMEIIEEIEPARRGLYTGSIGYIDFRGNMDLNIVIRTMVLKKLSEDLFEAKMQFGAGIVADSVGKYEYRECLKKGQALFNLL